MYKNPSFSFPPVFSSPTSSQSQTPFGSLTTPPSSAPFGSSFPSNTTTPAALPPSSAPFGSPFPINTIPALPPPSTFGSSFPTNTTTTLPLPLNSAFGTNATAPGNDPSKSQILQCLLESKQIQAELLGTIKHLVQNSESVSNNNNNYIHQNIFCNNCQTNQTSFIVGIRYKCAFCPDFDLCEKCENTPHFNDTHCFLKIKNSDVYNTTIASFKNT